ncbi:alcohol dehydrogenase catalytic domain-containing protein [Dactylosporangium cerinum]|uniref:Alcohol dehydrogenase catalytic domain-containing protein n=1 Tax=Dactylosporangium cerinum TaxID=1434730 RepID=A0ABV9VUR4_9ACTN
MKATVLNAVGTVSVVDVADPVISEPTDAVVQVALAAVCGSDLWPYRGAERFIPGDRMGHEWLGIVADTGTAVTTIRPGDLVLAPFAFADGTCAHCRRGLFTSCPRGGFWGGANDGGQAEAVRVPYADATLVAVHADHDPGQLRRLLPLTDVMATGVHAITLSGVRPGDTVAVIGDGAVGLSAVLAARRAGAERIVLLGRHDDRTALASRLGATDIMRDPTDLLEQTRGGVTHVAECAGTQTAIDDALTVIRPGGTIASVGVPNGINAVDLYRLFRHNITLRPGVTPVRRYLEPLISEVLAGTLDPSPLLDYEVPLDNIATAYHAMDQRRAIKAVVTTDTRIR